MTEKKKRRDTKENYIFWYEILREEILWEEIGKKRVAEESLGRGEKERESEIQVFAVGRLSRNAITTWT